MAQWYVFDLSFFIPDSKRKRRNNFKKMKKLMKNLTKYLKNIAARISKKIFSPGQGDGNKRFFYFGLNYMEKTQSILVVSTRTYKN